MDIWWILIPLILIHVVLAFAAAPPNAVARKILRKFDVHQQVNENTATVTFDDKPLEDTNRKQIIDSFNKATLGYRYYKFPGYSGIPFVIHTKAGKHDVRIYIYTYENRVDVFKEYNKKVIAYRLVSEDLQKLSKTVELTLV